MVLKVLDRLEEVLISFLMAAATAIIFAAVVHRYAAGISFLYPIMIEIDMAWAQELCIIMFVWMAKFGAAYGVRTGIHVGVDVLINRMDTPLRSRFIIFGLLAGALFTGIVGSLGAVFVWENGLHYFSFKALGLDMGQLYEGPITPDLEWPTWIVYSAIPLGSSLMCFRFLQVAWAFVKTGELPHHDHSHVAGIGEEDVPAEKQRPEDLNWFELDNDLHPRDVAHHPEESRKDGEDRK